MELYDGESLGGILRSIPNGILDEDIVQKVVWDFMWALNHYHAQGILHSDIKPDNVLLSTSNEENDTLPNFKLVNFGAGLFHLGNKEWETCRVGTMGYLAPKCVLEGRRDHSSDYWSVRMIL